MKNLTILITLLIILFLSGCNLFKKQPINIPNYQAEKDITNVSTNIKESTNDLSKANDNIRKGANDIKDEVKKIEKKNLDINPNLDKITNNSDDILDETNNIENITQKLNSTQGTLEIAKDKIGNIEKNLETLTKERDKAIIERDKATQKAQLQTQKTLRWIIFACLICFGISITLFIQGNRAGIAGAIGSVATLILAITVSQHLMLIAWIGMGVLGIVVLFLIYEAIIQKNTNKELIKTTELTKEKLSEADKEELFGPKKATVDKIQSENTKKIVQEIKKKL